MSSDNVNMGSLNAKQIQLKDKVIFSNGDATKSLTILAADPQAAGNVNLTIASQTADANLVTTETAIAATQVNVAGATDISTAFDDLDSLLCSDNSASGATKRVTGANLKTYIGAGLPTGQTEANILVANSSGISVSVAMSGDVSVVATGATAIGAAKITTAMLQDDAVTTAKVLDANITAAKLAADSVETAKILDANITTAKLATASVTGIKLGVACIDNTNKFANNVVSTAAIGTAQVTAVKLAADAVTSDKLADQSEVVIANAGKQVFLSAANSSTQFRFNAAAANFKLEYSSDTGSTWNTVQSWDYP